MTKLITQQILTEIVEERLRQDQMWGEQNHPASIWLTILTEEVGEVAKAVLEEKFGDHDQANIREELIQVAAVALAFIESLDRNNKTE